ncbi:phage portal protein, HK97 family [Virgibacillus subterraneus]|uniref:Phage portal protein, HK97 family n=1 Tax=Virgibacillus subterraneus TaxID=621109 RepID=A0A1H9ECF6_9BACI|nr:phage portal protein [Virgibacillus subterraneus]SEQ23434.1 phage portal protein, HK97 family [Virgibacillus subterraneus]
MYDYELFEDTSDRIYYKRLAIATCVNMIARTISQSEFRIKKKGIVQYDEFYYRLNVRPNKNQSASRFWETVIYKLIHDNECLIIVSDSDDLLIADDFAKTEYALMEDVFKSVTIKNFTYSRSFVSSEVIYLEYSNEDLSRLIDSLYTDYGELFGRMLEFQKHNNQIRSTVDMENVNAKDPETQTKLQNFINKMYEVVKKKAFAIVPQQKGFVYSEQSSRASGASVEEINKITNGFLDHVAKALGIPVALVHGDMSDVENSTRNYMTFCIDPIIKEFRDEFTGKFVAKKDFLKGERVSIRRISYRDIFDLAAAVDKLVSSSVFTGNEVREEAGYERSNDELLDKHIITKNYTELEDLLEGGDK